MLRLAQQAHYYLVALLLALLILDFVAGERIAVEAVEMI